MRITRSLIYVVITVFILAYVLHPDRYFHGPSGTVDSVNMGWWMLNGFLAAGYPAYSLFKKNLENKWFILVASLVGIGICFVCMFSWASVLYFYSGADSARGLTVAATLASLGGAFITLPCAWLGWWNKKPKKPKSYAPPDPGIFKQEE